MSLFILCIVLIVIFIFGIFCCLPQKDAGEFIFVLFLLAAFGFLCLYAGLKEKERQAIVAGAAHYKTKISEGGSVSNEFVWGPEKKE